MKTSEAQRRASRKWDEANKEKKAYSRHKSGAKKFAEVATDEDLLSMIELYTKEKERRDL